MNKPRVAVLGCGVWGRNHVRVFSDMKNVELARISDISEKLLSELGGKYNLEYSTDPMDVFNDSCIDAVTICTPTVTHFDLAKTAIMHGLLNARAFSKPFLFIYPNS